MMTEKQALALFESQWWVGKCEEDIVGFQLFEGRLCMPFSEYHHAVEHCLKRPVFIHEFAWVSSLQKEFLKEKPAPTFQQICDLIPEDKRFILFSEDDEQ